jgi:hypothetical protein
MPLTTASFSVSQPVGESNVITLTDTSTGTDGRLTNRHIYLRKSDGTYLTLTDGVDYIDWDYADESIDVDILDKDYALWITVYWMIGEESEYNATGAYGLTSYNEDFDYQLTNTLALNPLLVNDNFFIKHKTDLRTFIDSGDNAIARAQDVSSAQICYDKATELRLNSKYYFNESQIN